MDRTIDTDAVDLRRQLQSQLHFRAQAKCRVDTHEEVLHAIRLLHTVRDSVSGADRVCLVHCVVKLGVLHSNLGLATLLAVRNILLRLGHAKRTVTGDDTIIGDIVDELKAITVLVEGLTDTQQLGDHFANLGKVGQVAVHVLEGIDQILQNILLTKVAQLKSLLELPILHLRSNVVQHLRSLLSVILRIGAGSLIGLRLHSGLGLLRPTNPDFLQSLPALVGRGQRLEPVIVIEVRVASGGSDGIQDLNRLLFGLGLGCLLFGFAHACYLQFKILAFMRLLLMQLL